MSPLEPRKAHASKYRTPAQHYRQAEAYLEKATEAEPGSDLESQCVRLAQVHATLATVLAGTAAQAEDLP